MYWKYLGTQPRITLGVPRKQLGGGIIQQQNNRYQIVADVHIPLERRPRSAGVYTSPVQLEDHPWWTLARLHQVNDRRRDIGSLQGKKCIKRVTRAASVSATAPS